jgi:diacylglycerol kinase (ATP)
MVEKATKNILFIINPISGTGKKKNLEKLIDQGLDKSKFVYRIVYTEAAGQATLICREAVEQGADAVIAVGGDGTANEVGQALVGTETVLGIIPSGSGNGLARHLKIPFNTKKAVEVINRFKLHRIDTATINEKVFLSIAGVGYDAFVAKKFAKAAKRGFFSYFRIVSGEYKTYRPKKYVLEVDGKTITRRALLITFANSNQFGNNTSISPEATIDDGFIDICILRRIPLHLIPFYVPMLFTKTFHKTQYIEIIRAKEATITRKKGKTMHFDGDPMEMGKRIEMKVNPASLKIIVP